MGKGAGALCQVNAAPRLPLRPGTSRHGSATTMATLVMLLGAVLVCTAACPLGLPMRRPSPTGTAWNTTRSPAANVAGSTGLAPPLSDHRVPDPDGSVGSTKAPWVTSQ